MKFRHIKLRLNRYIRKYGILKTIQRLFEYLRLTVIRNKYIIFFIELTEVKDEFDTLPENITIESRQSKGEISLAELERLSSYWIREIIKSNIDERFNRDGDTTLWLLKNRGEIAAFIWSTTKPWERDRFFPFGSRDIYIFDGYAFPEYRGRRYHSILTKNVFKELKRAGFIRCFRYVEEQNADSLLSGAKAGWEKIGKARKLNVFGYDIVIWLDMAIGK